MPNILQRGIDAAHTEFTIREFKLAVARLADATDLKALKKEAERLWACWKGAFPLLEETAELWEPVIGLAHVGLVQHLWTGVLRVRRESDASILRITAEDLRRTADAFLDRPLPVQNPAGNESIDPRSYASTASAAEDGNKTHRIRPSATVNARMLEEIQKNPDAKGWTCKRWGEYLKCGASTVAETQTWKQLELLREQLKAERAKDRRRKPRASDLRRD